MGCSASTEKARRRCKSPYSPEPRSYSMRVHHPPERKGDSYHVVALTSSTVGSLKVQITNRDGIGKVGNLRDGDEDSENLTTAIIEAKAWSAMIDEKIPKLIPRTPTRNPMGLPETINTWELMEGLEDTPHHHRSFSFDVLRPPETFSDDVIEKPMWLQMAETDGIGSGFSEFDPEIIASFRDSPEKTPPAPETETAVLYLTSLRGIRKTYEDCCNVKTIMKSIGVRIDERDVSMDSNFKEELRDLLKELGIVTGGLPGLFIGKGYVGGAEEIRRLLEDGQLEKLLDRCERVGGDGGGACDGCGDVRFVPCGECSGSCKIYREIGGDETEECGFQRCGHCNENGLVRCSLCCY